LTSLLSGTGLINQLRLRPGATPTTRPMPASALASATRPGAASAPSPPGVISGYGQIFDNVPPARLVAPAVSGQPAAIELVTCWGSGMVNVRRASEATLRLIASPPLTGPEVTRLIDARNAALRGDAEQGITPAKPPTTKVSTQVKLPAGGVRAAGAATPRLPLLGVAGVSDRNAVKLTETSRCHSLWVITRTKQRDYHYFSVRDESEGTGGIAQSAVW
jgi:hypothetical protein